MLTIARSDDSYVAALDAKGFSTNSTIEHDGKVYTHDDIAAMTEAAYRKHRPEYAIICGGKPRVNRKRIRQLDKAVKSEVYGAFGISWWTVAMGALMFVLAGPMGLVIACVSAYFEWLLGKDLDADPQMMMAMGAA